MADYCVTLSCGCLRTCPSIIHPFPGALLACPAHGDARSIEVERIPVTESGDNA